MNAKSIHPSTLADHPAADGQPVPKSPAPDCAGSPPDAVLQLALETGRLGTWQHNLVTGQLAANAGARALYGFGSDDALTYETLLERVHSDDGAAVRRAHSTAIEQKTEFEVEYRTLASGETIHWVLERGRAIYDDCGAPAQLLAVTLDVSAQRKAEDDRQAAEQLFALFMGNLAAAAWIKDLKGRYVFANDEAVRIFATDRPQLYGRTDEELFASPTARQFAENDRLAVARRATVETAEILFHADGPHQSIVRKFPILGPDGLPLLVAGIAIDVTDRMRAEDELRANDRRKDEFLAMLAHELRNPLAAVKNALQITRLPQLTDKDRTWTQEVMDRQVAQLARLIDDLLDVSRITRGKIQLKTEPLDLRSVVERAVESVRAQVEQQEHKLMVASVAGGPLWVEADPTRLEQVLVNLLTNAAKYTNRGGQIWLTSDRDGPDVVVRVKDTGMGISAEMLPHIFELFAQADRSIDRSQGGLGIGLTLVRKLVEMHGGCVAASSQGEGRGSQFTVRLPAANGPAAKQAVAQRPARAVEARKILVVDDNRDSATALAMLLKFAGHETQLAFDGPQALAEARRFLPDAMLLDIGLPGMDGYAVARSVRQTSELAHLVLVAVSGYGQPDDRRRSAEAGFDHHLVKPVDHNELLSLVSRAVDPMHGAGNCRSS